MRAPCHTRMADGFSVPFVVSEASMAKGSLCTHSTEIKQRLLAECGQRRVRAPLFMVGERDYGDSCVGHRSITSGSCRLIGPDTTRRPERFFRADPRHTSLTAWSHSEARGHQQRSEEHTSELQSRRHLVCRLLLE